MPVCVKKMQEKWRIVECRDGTLVRNDGGNPVDGGGHSSKEKALKQATAINISQGTIRSNN